MTHIVSDEVLGRFSRQQIVDRQKTYLKTLYDGKPIILPPAKGSMTIAKSSDIFAGYLDSNFKNWGTDKKGIDTEEVPVSVLEIRRNGTFAQFLGSLSDNLEKLHFSQGQIVEFAKLHRNKLRAEGYGTFFLFKVGKEYFVANIFKGGILLEANVDRFDNSRIWRAVYRHRFVVPQLKL